MLDWLTHYIQPLSWIAGAIAVSAFVLRWAFRGARWLWVFLRRASEFLELGPTIEQMGREFNTNGGSSLKDQLNRVEATADKALAASEKTATSLESLQKMVLEEETQTRVTRRVRAR